MTNIKQLTKIAMKQKEEESKSGKNRPLSKGEEYSSAPPVSNTYKGKKTEEKEVRDEKKIKAEVPRNAPLHNSEEETPKVKKPGIFRKLHDFDFNINKENEPKMLPFILYISFWIVLYISNHHAGEKTLLKINRVNKEMKDLKADYYTSNAELSNKSIQSKVLEMVDTLGLKELRTPPHRLKLVKEDEH